MLVWEVVKNEGGVRRRRGWRGTEPWGPGGGSLLYELANPPSPTLNTCFSHLLSQQPKLLMYLLHLPHNYRNKKCTTEKSDSFFFQLKSASACLPYAHPFPKQENYILLVLLKFDFGISITPTYKWDVFLKFVLQVSSLKLRISFPEERNLKELLSFQPDKKKYF